MVSHCFPLGTMHIVQYMLCVTYYSALLIAQAYSHQQHLLLVFPFFTLCVCGCVCVYRCLRTYSRRQVCLPPDKDDDDQDRLVHDCWKCPQDMGPTMISHDRHHTYVYVSQHCLVGPAVSVEFNSMGLKLFVAHNPSHNLNGDK